MPRIGQLVARACAALVFATIATALDPDAPLDPPAVRAADAPPPCVDGLDLVAPTSELLTEAVVARSVDDALLAGGAPLSFGRRRAMIARFGERGWHVAAGWTLGQDAGLMGIDGVDETWAVGYVRRPSSLRPLVVRKRSPRGWHVVPTPARRAGATLTDVAVDRSAGTWAVGYTIGQPGHHRPWVLRWDGRRFVDRSPSLRRGERGRLTAASASPQGGTWIAGSVLRGGVVRPYIARRSGGAWRRHAVPDVGEAAIADIDVPVAGAGWAVGYRHLATRLEPLVLRWDGTRWTSVDTSEIADHPALLLGSWSADGAPATLVGAAWDPSSARFEGLTARGGAGGWSAHALASLAGQTSLTAVDGTAPSSAWLAGSGASVGVAARTCAAPGTGRAGRRTTRERRRRQGAVATASTPRVARARVHAADERPRPAAGLGPAPRLRITPAAGLVLRDRTAAAGLPRTSSTWGAVIADFDSDEADDIFLGRHGSAARLFVDRGTTFVDAGVGFGNVDRHGCAASDIDGSGLPDLYCSVGGRRGTGVKANQLWLDPAGSGRTLDPLVGQAPEPLGRGRIAAFLDVDDDGHDDLFVGQETERMDGLPSDGRIYLRGGPGRFRSVAGSGIDPGIAAWSVSTGDIDADGRTDLLLVHSDPHSLRSQGGIRLYRNVGGRFRDETGRQRIRSIGETDAELADLDADGRADLIQLSVSRIRVSLKRADGYRAVFERRLDAGAALAVADVDDDGDQDIYVLRRKVRRRHDDVLLLAGGGPRRWRAVEVTSRHGGVPDDVYAIDHDGNGRADFLALNGKGGAPGPVQLIASFPE